MAESLVQIEPFGAVLGYAPGGVAVYSSDYPSADPVEMPNRQSYRNYVDGVYTGYKWQCVEFARRWLLLNRGYVFDDIAMAYDIFRLKKAHIVGSKETLPLHSFRNGSRHHPEPGCMLIWNEGGEFDVTGHVAIVTEVFADRIRVAEQNVSHCHWDEGCDYSRELVVKIDDDGSYWIRCSFEDASILGWVLQTADAFDAEVIEEPAKALFSIQMHELGKPPARVRWLNIANPDEAAYVAYNGHRLCTDDRYENRYLAISETAMNEIRRATNELHALFMHATNHVLSNETLLSHFNIPEVLWPRIVQSWNNRRNEMITGRFDFCLTEQGLKVYEYNADSASCHMEAGKIQGLWGKNGGCDEGYDPGQKLFRELVEAWEERQTDGTIHLLLDDEAEELYHTLFMQQTLNRAGVRSKLVRSLESTGWDNNGNVVDADGEVINTVWKTWAWETALDQLRDEIEQSAKEEFSLSDISKPRQPRLVDVLLRPETMVYEPLWTLIPSNKAILPILKELFPEHPYLLDSQFTLTDSLLANGYVEKPIAGRCGLNIRLVDESASVLSETEGRFEHQQQIYQELFKLPNVQGLSVQICTFTAGGSYAGACARVSPDLIIKSESDIMPLRVLGDREFLASLPAALKGE